MTRYYLTASDDESRDLESVTFASDDPTVRISTPAEDGEEVFGPMGWLNSARVSVNEADDSVTFAASSDDPRGAICVTI